jgi:hypothetical protein
MPEVRGLYLMKDGRNSHEGTLGLVLAETLKRISHKHALPDHWLEFCDRIYTQNPEANPKIWSFPLQNGSTNIPRIVVVFSKHQASQFPTLNISYNFLNERHQDNTISYLTAGRFLHLICNHGKSRATNSQFDAKRYSSADILLLCNEAVSVTEVPLSRRRCRVDDV